MAHKLGRLLQHCVLLFVFADVRWTVVFSAPTPTSCDELDSTFSHTELLEHEARQLLEKYVNTHLPGATSNAVPDEVPDSSVSGNGTHEKLCSIYDRCALFVLHLAKVKKYEDELFGSKLADDLLTLQARLSHQLEKMKSVLMEQPLPPAPLELSHDDFEAKVYGRGVLVRLRDWSRATLSVLEEMKSWCTSAHRRRRRA